MTTVGSKAVKSEVDQLVSVMVKESEKIKVDCSCEVNVGSELVLNYKLSPFSVVVIIQG